MEAEPVPQAMARAYGWKIPVGARMDTSNDGEGTFTGNRERGADGCAAHLEYIDGNRHSQQGSTQVTEFLQQQSRAGLDDLGQVRADGGTGLGAQQHNADADVR